MGGVTLEYHYVTNNSSDTVLCLSVTNYSVYKVNNWLKRFILAKFHFSAIMFFFSFFLFGDKAFIFNQSIERRRRVVFEKKSLYTSEHRKTIEMKLRNKRKFCENFVFVTGDVCVPWALFSFDTFILFSTTVHCDWRWKLKHTNILNLHAFVRTIIFC